MEYEVLYHSAVNESQAPLSGREKFLKEGMSAHQREFDQQTTLFVIFSPLVAYGHFPWARSCTLPLREQLQEAQTVHLPSKPPRQKPRAPGPKQAIRIVYTQAEQRASRFRKESHAPDVVDIPSQFPDLGNGPSTAAMRYSADVHQATATPKITAIEYSSTAPERSSDQAGPFTR